MLSSVVVWCLISVAYADKLGYNYRPVFHSENGLSFTPGALSSGLSFDGNAPLEAPSYVDSSTVSYTAPAELEKEFYTFYANEAEFDDGHAVQQITGAVKQGLRVIFIKGPENKGFEEAALALARQASQQKTAIYVLNKQADIGDLANKLNAVGKASNPKPEVHFVKYRTPEDAVNAQKAIQSQYDSYGGKSQHINGGFVPVINFASHAAVQTPQPQQPQNAYLPSSVFRRRV